MFRVPNISSTHNSSASLLHFKKFWRYFSARSPCIQMKIDDGSNAIKTGTKIFNGIRSHAQIHDGQRAGERAETYVRVLGIISGIFFRRGFQFAGSRATRAQLGEGKFLIKNITFAGCAKYVHTCYTHTRAHASRQSRYRSRNLSYSGVRRKHVRKTRPTSRSWPFRLGFARSIYDVRQLQIRFPGSFCI